MVPIQARAEATRQVIIDAGVELFGSVGYGDTDMIDVINHANTTKGTCYYHFPTKKSLALAIIEQSNNRIAAVIGPLWETEGAALHKLVAATFAFLAVTESDPVARVGYQLNQADRQVSRSGQHGFGDTEVVFTDALKKASAEGYIRKGLDVGEAAYTLFAALVGVRLLADVYNEDPFERLEEAWRTLLPSLVGDGALKEMRRVVRSESRKYRTGV